MNFQNIKQVKDAEAYLDVAFRKSRSKEQPKSRLDKLTRLRNAELSKLDVFRNVLVDSLQKIIDDFPRIKELPMFYQDMMRNNVDLDKYLKSLSSIKWVNDNVSKLQKDCARKIFKAESEEVIRTSVKGFQGRVASMMKQINKFLDFLEKTRRIMKDFPHIEEGAFIVCLAGFPNVGKSTVLSKITSSKPEIKDYSFTTKNLNSGFLFAGLKKVQIIDTPGTLAREDKMNVIEKMAYLAIKLVSNIVIFVFDPTYRYTFDDQVKLFYYLKQFDKETFVYISKTDIADKKNIDQVIDFCTENELKYISDVKDLSTFIKKEARKKRE
ncbi:50S ribosome-binding GTPase [Candidatus Woesearchaeota archaeon]|nr:50S ribosome-binding GTPase [Candidatus Woesearchaeota archaeon]MCF7901154.1 50S ribosome-binding GTPase [Candidatus Woesearchaeota archaeon]MCF8013669.1 50S ribosome-binding GTPase [Candidatus Woesearchaeota archaeon]